jgi:hypothetical protein
MEMKRLNFSLVTAGIAGLALGGPAYAQTFKLELGAMSAMAVEELADTDLGGAGGVGGTLAIRVFHGIALYGGWDWLRFYADRSFAGDERFFEESGYTFGLRFEHAILGVAEPLFRIEGGRTYRHVEIKDDDVGDLIANSGYSLGFEIGAGMTFPLDTSWRLSPMLRYRSLSPAFDVGDHGVEGDLHYGALEVRVARVF